MAKSIRNSRSVIQRRYNNTYSLYAQKISAHARTFIVRISALNGLEFLIFYFGAAAAAATGLRNFSNTAH